MSCFTVNKFLDAMSSHRQCAAAAIGSSSTGKPSPSPKRRQRQQVEILQECLPQHYPDRNVMGSDACKMRNSSREPLHSLKEEVQNLSNRLKHISSERDYFESTLNRVQLDKLRLAKERDDQLRSQSARYEERLVELHSVIAELSRQLEQRSKYRITDEEEEEEEEEGNGAGNSGDEEEGFSVRISEMASRTSTDILDAQAVEAGRRLVEHLDSQCPDFSFLHLKKATANGSSSTCSRVSYSSSSSYGSDNQMLAAQLSDAKERNLQLTAKLQQRETELVEVRAQLEEAARQQDGHLVCGDALPATKVAEKKRIKTLRDEDEQHCRRAVITGADLTLVRSSVLAQHLVQDIRDESSMQEFSSLFSSELLEGKMREFEIEMERLSSKIEHLRSQNDVLTLTLQESKDQCDNLTVLIGKYESNHTAQQLVLSYSGHVVDSLEVLLALLETEMGLLLANCRAAGLHELVRAEDDDISGEDLMTRAAENRRAAEGVARRLIVRLEARPDSGFSSGVTVSGAWEESASSAASSCCTGRNSRNENIMNRGEETKLREFVAQLKTAKSAIQSTVMPELESLYCRDEAPISANEARTADLETAVLVQELMAMREERADLRAQVFMLEREKSTMELMLNSQQAQELALKSHIQQMQKDMDNCDSEKLGRCSGQEYHRQDRDEMRQRITELLQALERVKRNSELRQQQQDEVITDMKRTNTTLADSLERTKKKYQQKLRRLEQQILQTLMQKQFGKNFDLNSQSIHSCVSTETDPTSD